MMLPATWRKAVRLLALPAAVLGAGLVASIATAASPTNDAFAQAQVISGETGSTAGTNVDATNEAGEPSHAENGPFSSVWYRWTPSASGSVRLDTCESSFDTVVAVYTGSAVDALTEVASNDDACGLGSAVTFAVAAGTVYHVAIDGFDGDNGTFDLRWAQPPANVSRPAVSGLARDGETLLATPGTWSGAEPLTFRYRWQRCATTQGSQNIALNASTRASAALPAFPAALAVDGDRATSWSSGQFPPQWIGIDLGSPHAARGIRLVVGQQPAGFTAHAVWGRGPSVTDPFRLLAESEGDTADSSVLERTFPAAGEIQFVLVETRESPSWVAWREIEVLGECADIQGAGTATYALRADDVGSAVRVAVTASNASAAVTAVSETTPVVAGIAPENVTLPAIVGTARINELLTAHPGTWRGTEPIEFLYQWQRCDRSGSACLDLDVGELDTYLLGVADVGRRIRVRATASNRAGSGSATSALTGIVQAPAVRRCIVPNVRRRTLAAARRVIRRAGCTVGRIRRVRSRRARGRVIAQTPRPGLRRPRGTRVNLVVSRGRR